MYETIAASGMRRGEACGLAWDYLDLDEPPLSFTSSTCRSGTR